MTNQASKILSKLIDVNWEFEQATNSVVKEALNNHCSDLKNELIDEMGEDEYYEFIKQGKRMFS